jgi:hypothetical protein
MKKILMSRFFIFSLVVILMNQNFRINGAVNEHDSVLVRRSKDFSVTGDGKSVEWQNTRWIKLRQQSSENPAYETKVKILYSATGMYFLFNCSDKKVTSSMKSDNLHLWEEDVVEVFLWTDEKFPVYFEYELSPFNYELPIMVPNNKGKFLGWLPWDYVGDRKTRHATSVTGGDLVNGGSITGWMAEIFIPFKLLTPLSNVPPESGSRWRANMYRIDYDSGTEIPFEWQKTSQTFHEYEKFGTFIFE